MMNRLKIACILCLLLPGVSMLHAQDGQTSPTLIRSQLNLMARTYGDSIVVRWAPEDYVSWKYLNRYGYNLFKEGEDGIDTLAFGLKPLSKEQMLAKYQPADSLAAMAAELTWGDGRMGWNQTRDVPGSIGALLEMSEEQNMMFGMAELIAEWRPDLANDLALRIVDRNVKPGHYYRYFLQPTVWDPDSSIIFAPGVIDGIKNEPYAPQPLNIDITDTINSPYSVQLMWDMGAHSSFEIERKDPDGQWHRVNTNPFVPFLQEDVNQTTAIFGDNLPAPGSYDYRIMAHDVFGELTAPSPVHTVEMRDMEPPVAPTLRLIQIDRPEKDPSEKVLAVIYWTKDTLEADIEGFVPLYHHQKITGDDWKKLIPEPLTPEIAQADRNALPFKIADTEIPFMCVADVTGLPTGMVSVAAYDRAGNISASMPAQLRVEDMKPPRAPQNFRADVRENGKVILAWTPVDDDIDYYQVAFANDTTHLFQILNEGGIRDTTYTDSIALDVNQKYIYYKVRGTDYSTNEGEWSETLRVLRPTLVPPTVAHLDSAWHDFDGINMRWVAGTDATLTHHIVYRQTQGQNAWQPIMRCDADSVKAQGNYIIVFDNPDYNRQRRYRYCVESFNSSNISSGKSLVYSVLHQGPLIVKADIQLMGDYIKDKKETRLAWETSGIDASKDYYFSVYRKGQDEEAFRWVTTVTKDKPVYEDALLRPGQTAEYYVKLVMRDGRRSKPSNTVSVTAPAK